MKTVFILSKIQIFFENFWAQKIGAKNRTRLFLRDKNFREKVCQKIVSISVPTIATCSLMFWQQHKVWKNF